MKHQFVKLKKKKKGKTIPINLSNNSAHRVFRKLKNKAV